MAPVTLIFLYFVVSGVHMVKAVTIANLVVPEVFEMGDSSPVLDCQFNSTSNNVTLQWIFNEKEVVYEKSTGTPPKVSGVLEGRLDPTLKVSDEYTQQGAFRIKKLDPELSGNYTCVVRGDGDEARQTKAMLVVDPEDLVLDARLGQEQHEYEIHCSARRVYQEPELTLMYNGQPLPVQNKCVWRSGSSYNVTIAAQLRARDGRLACWLNTPLSNFSHYQNVTCALDTCDTGIIFSCAPVKESSLIYYMVGVVALIIIITIILIYFGQRSSWLVNLRNYVSKSRIMARRHGPRTPGGPRASAAAYWSRGRPDNGQEAAGAVAITADHGDSSLA